jgi:hypothetical protein
MTGAFVPPDEWYEHLKKPSWRSPRRLVASVWTVLYVMIAVSGWLIWREAGFAGAALPLTIYAIQIIFNAAWTRLFFGLYRPDLAFVDIVLVWLSIVAMIVLFMPFPRLWPGFETKRGKQNGSINLANPLSGGCIRPPSMRWKLRSVTPRTAG